MIVLVRVGEGRRACVEPFDEVDLPLVLPGPRCVDGPPFPGESHIPSLILGILEGCVIILQYDLFEDTIPAPAIRLNKDTKKCFLY